MSLYTIRTGAPLHPEDTVLEHLTDMVRKGGVLNPETDLLTVEPSGGGLNVDVEIGRGYIKKSGNAYPIRNTDTIVVPISANSSGNPRIDSIVIYLDLALIPDGTISQGNDVLVCEAVSGTPAASPVPPLEAAIESAIGASNPYIILDNVTVANGATGISTVDIERACDRVFMHGHSPIFTETYATPLAFDYNNSNQQEVTLTGNIVVSEPTNMRIGDILFIDFIQDATGGRTVTWTFSGCTVKEDSGEVALSGTANATDSVAIRKMSADTYYIYPVGGEIA